MYIVWIIIIIMHMQVLLKSTKAADYTFYDPIMLTPVLLGSYTHIIYMLIQDKVYKFHSIQFSI